MYFALASQCVWTPVQHSVLISRFLLVKTLEGAFNNRRRHQTSRRFVNSPRPGCSCEALMATCMLSPRHFLHLSITDVFEAAARLLWTVILQIWYFLLNYHNTYQPPPTSTSYFLSQFSKIIQFGQTESPKSNLFNTHFASAAQTLHGGCSTSKQNTLSCIPKLKYSR